MAVKVEINGKVVEFAQKPTPEDIDAVAQQLNIQAQPQAQVQGQQIVQQPTQQPTQPNTFQKLVGGIQSNLTSPQTRTLQPTGLPEMVMNPLGTIPSKALSAAGVPPENVAPTVGGLVGGLIGQSTGIPGARTLSATAGATGGDILKQLSKKVRGEGDVDWGLVGQDALITGLIEGVSGVVGRAAFGAARAARTAAQGTKLSKFLGSAGQRVADVSKKLTDLGKTDPDFVVPQKRVLDIIDDVAKEIDDFSGPQADFLKNWREIILLRNPDGVSAKTLIQMEKAFGANADFVPASEVSNPAVNQALKNIRRGISGVVDDLASKAGFPNFSKDSREVSRAIARIRNKRGGIRVAPTSAGFLGSRVAGAPGAILAAGGTAISESPSIMSMISNILEPTGIARGTTLTATEMGRKLIESLRKPQ